MSDNAPYRRLFESIARVRRHRLSDKTEALEKRRLLEQEIAERRLVFQLNAKSRERGPDL